MIKRQKKTVAINAYFLSLVMTVLYYAYTNAFLESVCEPIVTPIRFNRPCTPRNGLNFFDGYWGKFFGILILIFLFPAGM